MKNQKQISEHAQAAKNCRMFLKNKGIKCSVKSESYSMGSSVRVNIYNQPPEIVEMVTAELKKYQYGHFDGMQDLYEHSNSRDDIAQVKFLFVNNEFSDEIFQKAWDFLRSKYPANAKGLPVNYENAKGLQFYENAPHWLTISEDVGKLLAGNGYTLDAENSSEFWAEHAA